MWPCVQIQNAVRQATEQLQDLQQLQQQRNQQQVEEQCEDQLQKRHLPQYHDRQQLYHQEQQQLRHQEQQQLLTSCQPLTVKCEPELWGSRSRSPVSLSTSSPRSPIAAAVNNAGRPVQQRPHFPAPPPPPPANSAAPSGPQSAYISPKMTFANGSPKAMFNNGSPPGQQQLVTRLELPADENIQLEELEDFAKEFKQRRIKLGYTQVTFRVVFYQFHAAPALAPNLQYIYGIASQ
jgi:hypothetical protein